MNISPHFSSRGVHDARPLKVALSSRPGDALTPVPWSKREAFRATATSGTACDAAATMGPIIPKEASPMTSMVRVMPKRMFCRMVDEVRCPSRRTAGAAERSSRKRATSAASCATAVPMPPMAIPTSAAVSAGASLIPSPIMTTRCPCACSCRTRASCLQERAVPRPRRFHRHARLRVRPVHYPQ